LSAGQERSNEEESILDTLIRAKKFGEAIIFAWGMVEWLMDFAFLRAFGLWDENHPLGKVNDKAVDPRVRFLLNLSFGSKLNFLHSKDVMAISDTQYEAIQKFQERRNDIFHVSIETFTILNLPDEVKQERLEEAKKAMQASSAVAFPKGTFTRQQPER
jgi:hypothetical protein